MNKLSLIKTGIISSYVILTLLVVLTIFSIYRIGIDIFNLLLLSLSVTLAVFLRSKIKYGLRMSGVISQIIALISFFLLFIPAERYTQPTGLILYIGLFVVLLLFIVSWICVAASNKLSD